MNKTLSIGNFTELSENEVMETEGGNVFFDFGWWLYDYTHGGNDGGGKGIVPDPYEFADYRC